MTAGRQLTMFHVVLAVVAVMAVFLQGCGGGPSVSGGVGAGPEIVPEGVIFRYFDRKAVRVHVVGDFNNWSVRADPMVDKNGDGEWTLFYTLPPGRYEYKFVVDGVNWVQDPRNPESVPDGFEGRNSVIVIPDVIR